MTPSIDTVPASRPEAVPTWRMMSLLKMPRRPLGQGAAILSVLLVLGLHVYTAWDASAPVWMDDEVGYLANAQYLSGVGSPRFLGAIGYYSGWSLFLVPLWWFTDDPAAVYRAANVITALSGVILIVPLALIGQRLGLSRTWSIIVGSIVAIAPARTAMSGYVLAENFVVVVVTFTVLAAMRYHERPTPVRAAVLGGLAAYSFFTHGRVIPITAATLLWFGVAFLRGQGRIASVVGGTVCAGGSLAAHLINGAVAERIYDSPTDREGAAFSALLDMDPAAVLTAGAGLGWYHVTAWAALPLLGAAITTARALREVRSARLGVWLWWFVCCWGVLAISLSSVANAIARGSLRVEIFTYGRYVEPVVAVLATVGLASLLARARTSQTLGYLVAAVALVVVFLTLVTPQVPWGGRVSPINAPGIMQWSWMGVSPDATGYSWGQASAAGGLVVLAVAASRRRPILLAGCLGVAFALMSYAAEAKSFRVFDAPWRANPYPLVAVAKTLDLGLVSYDLHSSQAVSRNAYQFGLSPNPVFSFDSAAEDAPTQAVITRNSWPGGREMGAVKIAADPRFDEALWLLPGPLQADLSRNGMLPHEPRGGPMPKEAYSYDLRVERQATGAIPVSPGREPRIDLRLRHTGSGSPWLSFSDHETGYVRVVLYWQHPGGQSPQIVDLDLPLWPGQEVVLPVVLKPPSEVPPGRTKIRLGLVQEGVGPFPSTASDAVIEVDVRS